MPSLGSCIALRLIRSRPSTNYPVRNLGIFGWSGNETRKYPRRPHSTPSKKRSSQSLEDKESSQSKRQRLSSNPPISRGIHGTIAKQLIPRKLAFVSLDYGAFSSSIPSSFIRIGESCKRYSSSEDTDWTKDPNQQENFRNQEYFTLKLLAPLGRGAVGVVHPAQAELTLESGDILKEKLVFKLAFSEEQHQKSKCEFETYCRMSREDGIEGIIDIHGFFFNGESNVMGLLMADGGKTLRQREIERTGTFAEQVTITLEGRYVVCRDAFMRALKSLHRAKIWHQDIRADNLTIDSDGNVFIIDFDCAEWAIREHLMAKELSCLNDVLEGNYSHGQYYY